METKELIESMWCNCGLDNPEPKWHSVDCTYRVEWEDKTGSVHMTREQVKLAESVKGWKADKVFSYDPDFLDRIMMQQTEDAYYYGKRPWKSKLNYD